MEYLLCGNSMVLVAGMDNRCFLHKVSSAKDLSDLLKWRSMNWASVLPEFRSHSMEGILWGWLDVISESTVYPTIHHVQQPPLLGFFKLNYEGSCLGALGPAGICAIIKDDSRASMIAFFRPMAISFAHVVEASPLLFGLKLAKDRNLFPSILKEIQHVLLSGLLQGLLFLGNWQTFLRIFWTFVTAARPISLSHAPKEINGESDSHAEEKPQTSGADW